MTTEELPRPWLRQYDADTPHEIPLFDAPLYSLLDRAADQYPRRQALIFQNTRITYAALRERAERFAGALRRAGIAPGERVAVMLPNLPQTAEAFWGILKAGAIASTVGHDSHNLGVVGATPGDMAVAAEAVRAAGGGFAVAAGGAVRALLPLPIGGLMSDRPGPEVAEALAGLRRAARAATGTRLANPFLALAFLPLPVIPAARLTLGGFTHV